MTIETFLWPTQIQAGMDGSFSYNVRETPFGEGYNQITGDGINPETDSWPITLGGKQEEMMNVLNFVRRHVTKSFIWTNPIGEIGLYRVEKDSISPSPISSNVMTISAKFKRVSAP